jgi:hypothetical protein
MGRNPKKLKGCRNYKNYLFEQNYGSRVWIRYFMEVWSSNCIPSLKEKKKEEVFAGKLQKKT